MTNFSVFPPLPPDEERRASLGASSVGFHYRPPPPPHALRAFISPDSELFETIHMGAVDVDTKAWRLQVDGLVDRPFSIDMDGLRSMPAQTITAFHECYGSPLKPPSVNVSRIGNARWTGVRLATLLDIAGVRGGAAFIWSDGLDSGEYGGKLIDRYRKDLPLAKAMSPEVMLAYELNDRPLRRERGGPVRLIVPGWFGTNMTKWLCRISAQGHRAMGPYTTDWYNEDVLVDGHSTRRPVWNVAPNSIIVEPASDQLTTAKMIDVRGWAWAGAGIASVDVSGDGGLSWREAAVMPRTEYEWQHFECTVEIDTGRPTIMARATDKLGSRQPMSNARNSVLAVQLQVT
jgi:DMSO/TMAO reductase YedYZ molybdopterin-dependent catalytic subunit